MMVGFPAGAVRAVRREQRRYCHPSTQDGAVCQLTGKQALNIIRYLLLYKHSQSVCSLLCLLPVAIRIQTGPNSG